MKLSASRAHDDMVFALAQALSETKSENMRLKCCRALNNIVGDVMDKQNKHQHIQDSKASTKSARADLFLLRVLATLLITSAVAILVWSVVCHVRPELAGRVGSKRLFCWQSCGLHWSYCLWESSRPMAFRPTSSPEPRTRFQITVKKQEGEIRGNTEQAVACATPAQPCLVCRGKRAP